jgi:hypothetical protein
MVKRSGIPSEPIEISPWYSPVNGKSWFQTKRNILKITRRMWFIIKDVITKLNIYLKPGVYAAIKSNIRG